MSERSDSKPSIVTSKRNDLSYESLKSTNLRNSCLRKCFSCSQIHVLNRNSVKNKINSITRCVSLDEMDSSEMRGLLLNMFDISSIDSNKSNLEIVFDENPIIKITQNLENYQSFEHNINTNYDEESDNSLKLSANYLILSPTSAEGGSSPTDLSPSDYFSREHSESVEDVDDWDNDFNIICDKTVHTCAQIDSIPVLNTTAIDVSAQRKLNYDYISEKSRSKSRSQRSNSSDSAIICPFNEIFDFEDNIIPVESRGSEYSFSQDMSLDKSVKNDFTIESTPYPEVWAQCLKSNSHSCPHLETPSVVISDHSTHHEEKNEFRSEDNVNDGNNVLALALESYFTHSPKNYLRRDSISSISSSTSSLSSLGEEDFVEYELNSSSCKLSPISAWRKVRSLVTSPFIQTYKKQKYPWIQLAGHQGNFISGQIQGTILKKLNGTEENCFKLIVNDVIKPLTPEYRKTIKINNEYYLELEDLLAKFENPSIMDVKMGVRTYLEAELDKARTKVKLRTDMFQKMLEVDPNEPTTEENSLKAVTKPRYMIWRETISSTATLGFRIEGIKQSNGKTLKDFKRTKTEEQVKTAFARFIDNHPNNATLYLNKLIIIKETLKSSQFFKTHEIIGSSLLFVHDDKRADIWLIDFAKTYPLPKGIKITHQNEWQVGNHEDGYLIGIESLIRIFNSI